MLGDQIGEETGKITGVRVLDAVGPKVEVSFRSQGKIMGQDYQGRSMYSSEMQPGGSLFGETPSAGCRCRAAEICDRTRGDGTQDVNAPALVEVGWEYVHCE